MSCLTTKKEATEAARHALKLMKTKGWKIRIWNNLGWHFSLQKHGMSIYCDTYSGHKEYSVLFSTDKSCGGETFWTPRPSFRSRNPNIAVAKQLTASKAFIAECQGAINEVEHT